MSGKFIVLEGTDGAGKTTQLELIRAYYKENPKVLFTREPGGTAIGEEIRDILLSDRHMAMDPLTESYLYAASRAQHIKEFILPNLEKGNTVITDRFVASSMVYQGIARGVGVELVQKLNQFAFDYITVDLTIFLYLEPVEARKRMDTLDRIESAGMAFYQKIYEGYNVLYENDPGVLKIDASQPVETIFNKITGSIDKMIEGGF